MNHRKINKITVAVHFYRKHVQGSKFRARYAHKPGAPLMTCRDRQTGREVFFDCPFEALRAACDAACRSKGGRYDKESADEIYRRNKYKAETLKSQLPTGAK